MNQAGVLVVGYGNPLRSDDGVGWRAAQLLATDPRLAGARVLARHQLVPELALDVSRAPLVVLVDAAADGDPGSVSLRWVRPCAVAPDVRRIRSMPAVMLPHWSEPPICSSTP